MNRREHKAFTMVEMLLVVLVIAILVTIIIGVSKKVSGTRSAEATRLTMTQILDAIEAISMNDPNHAAPPEMTAVGNPGFNTPPAGWALVDWQAFNRNGDLRQRLQKNAVSAAKLPTGGSSIVRVFGQDGNASGPSGAPLAFFAPEGPFPHPTKPTPPNYIYYYNALADGFGKYMDYRESGGVGGTPLLISAGSDGKFGTQDDIRSDRR